MANVIKHKRGTSDPSPSDLVVGEIGIRTDVGKLFTKTDSGTVSEIAGGGSDIIINTLSSSSATGGGSATFNGSAYRFTLSQPPSVSAQQLLVSIAGVIQKPVAGSSQPSEGFSVSGNDIILASAPATGTDFFILTFKSLGVSEPADNTVTSAKIVDGTIVNADINASAAIQGTKITPSFSGNVSITNVAPKIFLTDSDTNSDFSIRNMHGVFGIHDQTNSVDRLTINSDGKVAINNVSNPQGIFNINTGSGTTIGNTLVLKRSGANDYHGITLTTGTTQDWSFGQNSLNAFEIYENGAASTTRLTILNGGNTGIGTRSPSEKLHVSGNIKATGSLTAGTASTLNGGATIGGNLTVNGFVLSQGTSNRGGIFGALQVGYAGTYLTVQPATGYNDLYLNYNNGSTVQIGHTSGSTLKVNGNIIPKTDSSSDLGLTGTRFRAAYVDTYYGDGSNLTGISGTTINNNSDDRLITGSGTANTLEGESTLLYDSTTLTLSKGGLTNGQKLIIRGSGNSTGDDLTINNWGNSDGDYWTIGVNLTANSGGSTAKTNTALRHSGVILDGRMGRVIFSASETSTSTKSDSHTFERDGSIKMKGSLYLDGETSSSHALDSYEEGSWTPTAHSGGSGVATIYAKYTKTGRVVHVLFRGYLTGLNGNSVQIGGLPYANLNNTNNVAAVMHNGFDYSGSTEPVAVSYISGQNSYFVLYFSQTNSNGWTSVSGNNTNGAQFITSLKYFTS